MSNPTQVVQVVANTISGIELSDVTKFEFEKEVPKQDSKLHKVDNGVVLKYGIGGGISDISFEKIPEAMMPASTQNAYQWYCDIMTTGIANSVNDAQGAAYLKTLDESLDAPGKKKVTYRRAAEFLRPNTKPWILFSDLDAEHFRYFDSIKLYTDMAARNFAYGAYDVTFLSDGEGLPTTEQGQFLAIPLMDGDVSPTFFQGDTTFKFNVAFHPNQTITLFWPAYWIGPRGTGADSGLSMAAMQPTTAETSRLASMRDASAFTRGLY